MTSMQPPTLEGTRSFERYVAGLRRYRALERPIDLYLRRREQVLYLAVGGWNTLFGYAVWAFLQYLLGDHLHYLMIVVMSWPIAVLNAYVGYRYVVFRSRGPILRELPRFSLVYLGALIVTLMGLPIALHVLPFSIYVVNALFTSVVVVCSYLAHKYFSFRNNRPGDGNARPIQDPTAAPGD
jgi:putative flippase GtrA